METRTDDRTLAARLHLSRRSLQVVLGVIWIFDGLLKFQPAIFKLDLRRHRHPADGGGSAIVVASAINHMANFFSHEATMWVAIFGLIEIAIGSACCSGGPSSRRSSPPSSGASASTSSAKGFGMVLTGHTSPLAGAPGAVVLLRAPRALVWPKEHEEDAANAAVGADSSAAGRGVFGGTGALLVWAAIWFFEAIIWMFPSNRTGNAVSSADGRHRGRGARLVRAFLDLVRPCVHGAGVVGGRASSPLPRSSSGSGRWSRTGLEVFIGLGIGLALVYWVTGPGSRRAPDGLGGTDPSNGPIIALIGLSILPLVPARADATRTGRPPHGRASARGAVGRHGRRPRRRLAVAVRRPVPTSDGAA